METIPYHGILINKDPAVPEKYYNAIKNGEYEEVEIEMIKEFGKDGDGFVIIGGCIEVVSCITLGMFPKSNLMSVEPNIKVGAIGLKNIILNNITERYRVIPFVCSEKKQRSCNFNISKDIDSSSIYDCIEKSKIAKVLSVTISEIIENFYYSFDKYPNFLILDAEGSEFNIIMDDPSLAVIHTIFDKLIVEFHPQYGDVKKCYDRIINIGYECVKRDPKFGNEYMFKRATY